MKCHVHDKPPDPVPKFQATVDKDSLVDVKKTVTTFKGFNIVYAERAKAREKELQDRLRREREFGQSLNPMFKFN